MAYFLERIVKDKTFRNHRYVTSNNAYVKHQLMIVENDLPSSYVSDLISAISSYPALSGKFKQIANFNSIFLNRRIVEFQEGYNCLDGRIESEEEMLLRASINGHYPDFELQYEIEEDCKFKLTKIIDFNTKNFVYVNAII